MKRKINKIYLYILFVLCAFFLTSCNIISNIDGLGEKILIPNGITIDATTTKITVGQKLELEATVYPLDYSQEVKWSSGNVDVATISKEGVVVGVSEGRTMISAQSLSNETIIGYFYLTVVKPESLDSDQAPLTISIVGYSKISTNEVANYHINTNPTNACKDAVWTSSDSNIAYIDSTGKLFGLEPGVVTITATSLKNDLVKTSIEVTVTLSTRDSDMEKAYIDVNNKVIKSVLGVANYTNNTTGKPIKNSIGSGFVYKVSAVLKDDSVEYNVDTLTNFENVKHFNYYLITNKHVVEGADKLTVYVDELEEELDATLIQYDTKVDIAVVYFESEMYFEPLRFGNSDELVSGTIAVAMGNPSGFEYSSSLTHGIISYPKRYLSADTDNDGTNDWDSEYVQHDVAINPGNSGGPLFNLYGQVIGINTLKFASNDIDNMGFSIPSNTAVYLIDKLEKGEVPVRPKIGITIIAILDLLQYDLSEDEYDYKIPENLKYGLYVKEITEDSVAQIGGILQDDVMLEFNNVVLKNNLQLRLELNKIIVGSNEEIKVKILREGKEIVLTLVF